ncbi:Probable methyltransferase [Mycobacteroides abscessus subsp. massiliense]|uniref:fatty-acid O-methyltransferase Mtf2 n=1 Tax=Mycobacteroides abscessus TaxID=36809 RepID=UPI0009D17BCF|nr:class I SAM-dependent methyltransferase [Mycobacteroides abscessus]SKN83347.1 Probable methyltransferase [Mycobacteroides abscessus subsp. massiliense]SKS87368.1 Probable methyltransferase [Mycobacteroides abscessus subsp. massiliense]SKT15507.1 Probable methyltransferase [Mycobacteroides abscessus subsp. massiliense]
MFKLNAVFTQRVQKFIYRHATRKLETEDVVFLNYGYEEEPAMGVPLSASDEPDRYSIQLYHSTATQADLGGQRVLEVGCGHGGGASYLMRALQPASYTGLDLNPDGISFCRRRHDLPGLEFVQGDAQDLPFPDESFDAVINVESSHPYPHFPVFLTEVARVLRPGGNFLYTDARSVQDVAGWKVALANAPLRMVSERGINAEVRRGMEKNLARWRYVIDRATPAPLRGIVRRFAPAQRAYDDLRAGGSVEYRMYRFVKA